MVSTDGSCSTTRDVDSAMGERIGHLDADVAGTDDDGGANVTGFELLADVEAVLHRVQDMNAGRGRDPSMAGRIGHGAGADHQRS